MARWCVDHGAQIVAVDAPCRWSTGGRPRSAELLLRDEKIQCFSTPARDTACNHDKRFYDWMLEGEKLFNALEEAHPLWLSSEAPKKDQRMTLETFPHAVACSMAGKVVKKDMKHRRDLLTSVGIDGETLTGDDLVDAALCAFVAHSALTWRCKAYGDPQGGFIVVPLGPEGR
jgi:predicted RNase H-like nuclease